MCLSTILKCTYQNCMYTFNFVTYICDKKCFLYVIYTYISFCNTNNRFRQPYKYEFCHTCIIFCATDMNACDNCVIVYRYIQCYIMKHMQNYICNTDHFVCNTYNSYKYDTPYLQISHAILTNIM